MDPARGDRVDGRRKGAPRCSAKQDGSAQGGTSVLRKMILLGIYQMRSTRAGNESIAADSY
jgi:hypothetical protein